MSNPKSATGWLMLDVPTSKKREFRQRWLNEVLPLAGRPEGIERATAVYLDEREELRRARSALNQDGGSNVG